MMIHSVNGCSSGNYRMQRWLSQTCMSHNSIHKECQCPKPFTLFPFPTQMQNAKGRKEWIMNIYRKDDVTGKIALLRNIYDRFEMNFLLRKIKKGQRSWNQLQFKTIIRKQK